MYIPVAMSCAPSLDMVRKSLSPFSSINVTSFRSTMHFRFLSARWVFFQHLLSSLTHNPTKRPCRIHFSSSGVSVLVIFNTSISFVWRIGSFACRPWRLALRSRLAFRCLAHAHFGTVGFKRNLVHHGLHHPDSTPVVGADVLGSGGIGHRVRVKSLSLVLDDNGNSLSQFTAAKNLNQLLPVHSVAMNDCIV